jgi:hypothetical protein
MSVTKYEILSGYKAAGESDRIRDSWANLGGALVTPTSRSFVKDMIYRVQLGSSNPDLEGALILCEAPLYSVDPLDWGAAVLEDPELGFFSFSQGIITPHFRLLLTGTEVALITSPVDHAFVPYFEMETATINIPDEELELILTEVGVPFVLMEELEFPKHKIINNMIRPAFQSYFKNFPIIKVLKNQSISTTLGQRFEVEMPVGAYGVTRAMIIQGAYGSAGPVGGNPLFWAAGGNGGGGVGGSLSPSSTSNRPGFANLQGFTTMALDRASRQGIINYSTRVQVMIERKNGKKYVTGTSNKAGVLEIHWAYASNDWDDIDYARQPEVRDLCTAKVLRALGMLRGQVKSDLPGTVDFAGFITRAKELEDKVITFWESIPRTVAIRGSL